MIFKACHRSHKPPFHTSIIIRMARFQKTRDHESPLSPHQPLQMGLLDLSREDIIIRLSKSQAESSSKYVESQNLLFKISPGLAAFSSLEMGVLCKLHISALHLGPSHSS